MSLIRACTVGIAAAAVLVTTAPLVRAGQIVPGPVSVCRKPMLAGTSAFVEGVTPGADAWTKLAERQADEAKFCYMAGDIELVEKGKELNVGLNTKCTEWRAKAQEDEVYVVIGPNRTWGRCP